MNVGQRIREAREELGMQRTVLARRLGVAPNTVWRYESGEREPSIAMMEKIAHELRTDLADLMREPVPLGEASETGPPRVSKERLQEHFEDVRPDEVDYLNWMIADFWRLAQPGEKPRAHFVPDEIDTDRVWGFLQHALEQRNVFTPEETERISRGALKKAFVG